MHPTMAPSESKANLATVPTPPTTLGPQSQAPKNHLEIPTNNPNLLSPDVLSQRRGNCLVLIRLIRIFDVM